MPAWLACTILPFISSNRSEIVSAPWTAVLTIDSPVLNAIRTAFMPEMSPRMFCAIAKVEGSSLGPLTFRPVVIFSWVFSRSAPSLTEQFVSEYLEPGMDGPQVDQQGK